MGGLCVNFYETAAVLLCMIGLLNLLFQQNLIKKSLGANLFSSAAFLFFGARGYVAGGAPAVLEAETLAAPLTSVNLIPTGLILTGIVVSVSMTAFFLALCLRVYQTYGSLDLDEILRRRGEEESDAMD